MRYVWRAGGWVQPPQKAARRTRVDAAYQLPGHYRDLAAEAREAAWQARKRRFIRARNQEARRIEARSPMAEFLANVALGWDAYDRSVGKWIDAYMGPAHDVPGFDPKTARAIDTNVRVWHPGHTKVRA